VPQTVSTGGVVARIGPAKGGQSTLLVASCHQKKPEAAGPCGIAALIGSPEGVQRRLKSRFRRNIKTPSWYAASASPPLAGPSQGG
jgi:hypothetical protein